MDQQEVALQAQELREKYLALQHERTKVRFNIPHKIRFPLVWTLFFTLMGVMVQSIQAGAIQIFPFFTSMYIDWFASFGTFAQAYQISAREFVYALLKNWYYFFFTGGLIALLWSILYTAIHTEVSVERHEFSPV